MFFSSEFVGIMLGDGGMTKNQITIRKLNFSSRSVPLINFTFNTLKKLGFTPKSKLNLATKRVWMYNTKEVKQYLRVVGSNNPRVYKW